jgi:hypothetical protein
MRAGGRIGFSWLGLVAALGVAGCSSGESVAPDSGVPDSGVPDSGGPALFLDGGGEAATPPDGKALCPVGACNYQTGEGCAANMTCAPSPADGKTPLCQMAGATVLTGPCQSWTDCVPGSICAGGFCRKLCCGRDWTGCTQGEHCLRKLEVQIAAQVVDTGGYLCFPVNGCNALEPSSCAGSEPGTVCQIADPTGATACFPEGTGVAGDVCPCKGGYTCVSNGCRRLCKAVAGGGEPSCPLTEGRCVHFTRDPVDVGECTP